MQKLFTFLACVAFASVAAGCNDMAKEYCAQVCDCEKCDERQNKECVIVYEADMKIATTYSCFSEFEEMHNCAVKDNLCSNGTFGPNLTNCNNALNALNNCYDVNSALDD